MTMEFERFTGSGIVHDRPGAAKRTAAADSRSDRLPGNLVVGPRPSPCDLAGGPIGCLMEWTLRPCLPRKSNEISPSVVGREVA